MAVKDNLIYDFIFDKKLFIIQMHTLANFIYGLSSSCIHSKNQQKLMIMISRKHKFKQTIRTTKYRAPNNLQDLENCP
jgi:hypothetical protein